MQGIFKNLFLVLGRDIFLLNFFFQKTNIFGLKLVLSEFFYYFLSFYLSVKPVSLFGKCALYKKNKLVRREIWTSAILET